MLFTNTRGIFSISDIRERQLSEKWFIFPNNFGYFGGGNSSVPVGVSTVDRINFSNDTVTASLRGPLSISGSKVSATGNIKGGYFNTSNFVVSRIDYLSDTQIASPRGSLSLSRLNLAATGNNDFGYFGGGIFSTTVYTRVDRIDYSNDTAIASVRGPLSTARHSLAATGNNDFGYFGGGTTAPGLLSLTRVDRIDYSNDLETASVRGSLSVGGSNLAATGNSSFGYFSLGTFNAPAPAGGPSLRTTVDRIDYSNDTATSSPRGPLSFSRTNLAATGNANFGYFGGGSNLSADTTYSTVDRIDYSNDTATASPRGPLSLARNGLGATSPKTISDTIFPTQLQLPLSFNSGYFGGGETPTSISTVERISYSNDTATASPRGPLSLARNNLAATGNTNFGYFGGGGINQSLIDRIDYSNDSATALRRGQFAFGRISLTATGNTSFGYFGGGAPGPISRVDRINYSNDTPTTSARGPLSLIRSNLAATGNANFGYFGGGNNAPLLETYSTVDRIDYSNDLATASPRGSLNNPIILLSATGNTNFGYFGFGTPGGDASSISTIDRIDYSNDTATASPRGSLSLARNNLAATGNANFGYFGGGVDVNGVRLSSVDRMNYANDTTNTFTRGSLSLAKNRLASTSAAANGNLP
jgi:hypothetical protein